MAHRLVREEDSRRGGLVTDLEHDEVLAEELERVRHLIRALGIA